MEIQTKLCTFCIFPTWVPVLGLENDRNTKKLKFSSQGAFLFLLTVLGLVLLIILILILIQEGKVQIYFIGLE